MCRILIYSGDAHFLKRNLRILLDSYKEVSKYDWIFEEYTGGKEFSHSDGWGFIGLTFNNGLKTTIHRSLTPFYDDDLTSLSSWVSSIRGYSILMLHIRAKSPNMDRNIFSIHPLETEAQDGSRLYLIHNGTINKEGLALKLEVDTSNEVYKVYNDTYFALKYIARRMPRFNKRIFLDIVEDLSKREYLVSAFNFGFIWLGYSSIYLAVAPIYRVDRGERLINYYKLYRMETDGNILYVSSTIYEWFMQHGYEFDMGLVENGEVNLYKVDIGRGRVTSIEVSRVSTINSG